MERSGPSRTASVGSAGSVGSGVEAPGVAPVHPPRIIHASTSPKVVLSAVLMSRKPVKFLTKLSEIIS